MGHTDLLSMSGLLPSPHARCQMSPTMGPLQSPSLKQHKHIFTLCPLTGSIFFLLVLISS